MPEIATGQHAMSGPNNSSSGFTVVELVIVVLLISIISAFAISRFLSVDTFDPAVVRDQLVSLARSAQQKSIGRSGVSLRVAYQGDRLRISVLDSSGVVQTASMSAANVVLRGDANESGACGASPPAYEITDTAPFIIEFDRLGDLLAIKSGEPETETEVDTAVRICINGDTSNSVCISAAGFAYRGACIE